MVYVPQRFQSNKRQWTGFGPGLGLHDQMWANAAGRDVHAHIARTRLQMESRTKWQPVLSQNHGLLSGRKTSALFHSTNRHDGR